MRQQPTQSCIIRSQDLSIIWLYTYISISHSPYHSFVNITPIPQSLTWTLHSTFYVISKAQNTSKSHTVAVIWIPLDFQMLTLQTVLKTENRSLDISGSWIMGWSCGSPIHRTQLLSLQKMPSILYYPNVHEKQLDDLNSLQNFKSHMKHQPYYATTRLQSLLPAIQFTITARNTLTSSTITSATFYKKVKSRSTISNQNTNQLTFSQRSSTPSNTGKHYASWVFYGTIINQMKRFFSG